MHGVGINGIVDSMHYGQGKEMKCNLRKKTEVKKHDN
jgi:hypothetical protein